MIRPAYLVAWLATAGTIVLATWPAMASQGSVYDPSIALTALTVVGLVWYTYFTRESLEHSRNQFMTQRRMANEEAIRYRESLATAVLAELLPLLPRTRSFVEGARVRDTPAAFLEHPMLKRAVERPELFAKTTIRDITAGAAHLRDIQTHLSQLPLLLESVCDAQSPKLQQKAQERVDTITLTVRTRASWAYNTLAGAVATLASEGGLLPPNADASERASGQAQPLVVDPFAGVTTLAVVTDGPP